MKPSGYTESELLTQILELARIAGWRAAHFRPARTNHGWRTAVQGDGAGFPDLVLVRDRIIYAELKSDHGRLSDDQHAWIQAITKAHGDARVWHPDDWPLIQQTLTGRREAL